MNNNSYNALYEILFYTAKNLPEKNSLIEIDENYKERTLNYKKLEDIVKKVSIYLKKIGVKEGDKIILKSENSIEWVIFFFAINLCGAICVPLDPKLSYDDLRNIMEDSSCNFCFLSRKQIVDLKIDLKEYIFHEIKDFNNYDNKYEDEISLPNIKINDLATLIYTSGTTGNPKAVMLSNKNYLANLKSIEAINLARNTDIFLTLLPFYHSFPFMVNLLVPIYFGATNVILKTLNSNVIKDVMKNKLITIVPSVPLFYKNLMDGILRNVKESKGKEIFLKIFLPLTLYFKKVFKINLGKIIFSKIHKNLAPHLRFFISGGARLEPIVFEFFYALGFNVIEGYGLTEASPVVSFNPYGKEKIGSVGIKLPFVEIKIDKKENESDGEICVKGENVMMGYWKNEKLTSETIDSYGWLKTVDLGYIDKDGYIFITGRKKDIIVLSNGKNIYPDEIETFFSTKISKIEDCIAIPYMKEMETQLAIVIKPKIYNEDEKNKIRENINYLSKELPEYKRPMKVFFTNNEIPKTNLGKYKRFKVKEMFQLEKKGVFEQKKIVEKLDEFENTVILIIQKMLQDKKNINLTDELEIELGVDSLKKLELTIELENFIERPLPDGFMSDIITVKDLLENLKKITSLEYVMAEQKKNFEQLLLEVPSGDDLKIVEEKATYYQKLMEFLLYMVIKITSKIFYRIEVKGIEQLLNETRPFILAPNHLSYLDGYIIAASLPFKIKKKLFFIGLSDFFDKTYLKILKNSAKILSFHELLQPLKAVQMSVFVLKKGFSLCIFPEGVRSYDGKLQELKKGIAYVAKIVRQPVYPVYIHGTFEAWPRFKKFPRFFKKITVNIGNPIFWEEKEDFDENIFLENLRNSIINLSKT